MTLPVEAKNGKSELDVRIVYTHIMHVHANNTLQKIKRNTDFYDSTIIVVNKQADFHCVDTCSVRLID